MIIISNVEKMNVLFIVGICVILGVFGQLLIKKGMNYIGQTSINELLTKKLFTILFNRYVFTGLILYSVASLLWFVVLSKADLSFAYPLLSLGYILLAILSWYFLGETLTIYRISGIILVTIGVFLILLKL